MSAARVFAALSEWIAAKEEAGDEILRAMGFDPEAPDTWPVFNDFTWDDYDSSFEMKGVDPAFVPTAEQWTAVRAHGFNLAWFCYTDGTERCYCGDRLGALKRRLT